MDELDVLDAFFDMDVEHCMSILKFSPDCNKEELERQYAPEVIQAAEKRLSLGSEIL